MPVASLGDVLAHVSPASCVEATDAVEIVAIVSDAVLHAHGILPGPRAVGAPGNGALHQRVYFFRSERVTLTFVNFEGKLILHLRSSPLANVAGRRASINRLTVKASQFVRAAGGFSNSPGSVVQPMGNFEVRLADLTARLEAAFLFKALPLLRPLAGFVATLEDLPAPALDLVMSGLGAVALQRLSATGRELGKVSREEAARRPRRPKTGRIAYDTYAPFMVPDFAHPPIHTYFGGLQNPYFDPQFGSPYIGYTPSL